MASEHSNDSSNASSSGSPSFAQSTTIGKYSDGPPWVFKGRALYQLHAVKSSVARKFVPPELKLVEAFGYTLGGLFLAHYDGSPAGEFDEAVIIAGIVWNAPTSCAWAAGVLVSNDEARIHGRREVGLPSHFAAFSHQARSQAIRHQSRWNVRNWFSRRDIASQTHGGFNKQFSVEISPRDGENISNPLCRLVGIPRLLSNQSPSSSFDKRSTAGIPLQLHLPNFSGKTEDEPNLLKYSCALKCRMRVVPAAQVVSLSVASGLSSAANAAGEEGASDSRDGRDSKVNYWTSILMGKPLVSILFDSMVMKVEAPSIVGVNPSETQGKEHMVTSLKSARKIHDLVLPGVSSSGTAPS